MNEENPNIGNYAPNAQGSNIINVQNATGNTFVGTQNNYQSAPTTPPTDPPTNLRYLRNPYFVGRAEKLQEVHQKLQESNQLAICAVSGMGGIGKTGLAVEYIFRHKEDYPGGRCWLEVRSGDIGSQIVNFGRSRLGLSIPKGLELPDQVGYCWQHWREGQVLLVYDDVTDFQAIAPFLPPRDMSRFKVLMTSRQRAGANYNSINLDVLDEGSALELLRSFVGKERIDAELEAAQALCAWLGYLPLGLELVGRFLKNNSPLTLVRLQERLNRTKLQAEAFIHPEQGDMTAKLGVAAAFELSWQDEKLTEEAEELGCRLSLFAPAPINWSLLEACYLGTQVWSVEQVENLEGEDYQRYLEQVKEENESLEETGDKVQEWLSEMDEAKENLELLRGKLLERSLVQELSPREYRLHPLIREFLQTKQIANLEDCKRDLCRVMVEIVKQIPETVTLGVIESFSPSLPHVCEVVQNLVGFLEGEDLIWPFSRLGRIYEAQSQFSEAEKWYKQSVKVARQQLGERHPSVATSYNNLALLYSSMGRNKEALPVCQQALEIRLEQLGKRHPDVAQSYNNIAFVYQSMGRYEDALPLHTQALEIFLEQLGERHPDVATSFNNLAFLYQSTGRYPEAIANYQKALSIAEESLGKEHPNTVTIRNNYLQMRHIRNKLKIISQMSRITSEFFSNPSTFNL
jgi:tetratricopeptide (TPR) repeat protein